MADQRQDKQENRGLKGALNKNFGQDEYGDSYLEGVKQGALRGLRGGMPEGGNFSSYALPGMLVILATEITALVGMPGLGDDVQVPHDATIQASVDGGNGYITAVSRDGDDSAGYMLVRAGDDYRMYRIKGVNHDGDDRLVYVDSQSDAWEYASDIARALTQAHEEAESGLKPDSVPDRISYEGISAAFNAPNETIFRVGDEPSSASMTRTDIAEMQNIWTEAAQRIGDGQYADLSATQDADYLQKPPFSDLLLDWGGMTVMVLGGMAGIGGVAGAVAATGRSRRRFKQDLKR